MGGHGSVRMGRRVEREESAPQRGLVEVLCPVNVVDAFDFYRLRGKGARLGWSARRFQKRKGGFPRPGRLLEIVEIRVRLFPGSWRLRRIKRRQSREKLGRGRRHPVKTAGSV